MTSVAFESAKRHAAMNVKKSEEMLQQYQGINMLKKVAPVLFVNIIEYTAYDANALKTLILTSVVKQFASAMGPFEWDQSKLDKLFGIADHGQIVSFKSNNLNSVKPYLKMLCDAMFLRFKLIQPMMKKYQIENAALKWPINAPGSSTENEPGLFQPFVIACEKGRLRDVKHFVSIFGESIIHTIGYLQKMRIDGSGLYAAILGEHYYIVKYLMKCDSIEKSFFLEDEGEGYTILHHAMTEVNLEGLRGKKIVKILCKNMHVSFINAITNVITDRQLDGTSILPGMRHTALDLAEDYDDVEDIIRRYGGKTYQELAVGQNELFNAIWNEDVKKCKELLGNNSIDLSSVCKEHFNYNALHFAAKFNYETTEIVELLCEKMDLSMINQRNSGSMTPLDILIERNDIWSWEASDLEIGMRKILEENGGIEDPAYAKIVEERNARRYKDDERYPQYYDPNWYLR
jgi:hypothetical protein